MKKILGIIAVGAIAFGAVSAAATALTVNGNNVPAQGSRAAAECADSVAVAYTTSGSDVTAITLTDGGNCGAYTPTISSTDGTIPAGTMGSYDAGTDSWTYTLTSAESIATFDPGTVTVTLK